MSVSGSSGAWVILSPSGGSREIGFLDASFALGFNRANATSYIATTTGKLFALRHATGTLTELVDTALEFYGLVLDEVAQLAYVGAAASVEVFDIGAGRFVGTIATGIGLHLTLAPDRRKLYVSGNGALTEVNLVTMARRSLGKAQATAITADGKTLYAVSETPNVLRIALETGATQTLATLPCGAWGLALTRDGSQLYATCPNVAGLQIVDVGSGKVVREHRVLDQARRVSFSADGSMAAISMSSGVAIVR